MAAAASGGSVEWVRGAGPGTHGGVRACRAFVAAAPPSGWMERRRLSSDTSIPRPHWLRCTVHSKSMWWSRTASEPERRGRRLWEEPDESEGAAPRPVPLPHRCPPARRMTRCTELMVGSMWRRIGSVRGRPLSATIKSPGCSPALEAAAPPSGWMERRQLSSDTSMPRPHWLRCTVHSKSTGSAPPPAPHPAPPALHEARRRISWRVRAGAGGMGGMGRGGWAGAGRCQLVSLVSGL